MKSESIHDYILKNERNLGIAGAVGEAWPIVRGQIVSAFLDRLGAEMGKKLKGWQLEPYNTFFTDAYGKFFVWKPSWPEGYSVSLECVKYGQKMVFGLWRDEDMIRKREFYPDLLAAVQERFPSARSMAWWEAMVEMHSPAADWREPKVLWRMHKDDEFLDEVSQQLLDFAKACAPIMGKMATQR